MGVNVWRSAARHADAANPATRPRVAHAAAAARSTAERRVATNLAPSLGERVAGDTDREKRIRMSPWGISTA
jgi:hypothetical protein